MNVARIETPPTRPPGHVVAGSSQMPAAQPRALRAAGCPSARPPLPTSSRANLWRPEGPPFACAAPAAATLWPASAAGRPRSRSRTEFGARLKRAGPGLSAINAGSLPEPMAELQSHFGTRAADVTGVDATRRDRVGRAIGCRTDSPLGTSGVEPENSAMVANAVHRSRLLGSCMFHADASRASSTSSLARASSSA